MPIFAAQLNLFAKLWIAGFGRKYPEVLPVLPKNAGKNGNNDPDQMVFGSDVAEYAGRHDFGCIFFGTVSASRYETSEKQGHRFYGQKNRKAVQFL